MHAIVQFILDMIVHFLIENDFFHCYSIGEINRKREITIIFLCCFLFKVNRKIKVIIIPEITESNKIFYILTLDYVFNDSCHNTSQNDISFVQF